MQYILLTCMQEASVRKGDHWKIRRGNIWTVYIKRIHILNDWIDSFLYTCMLDGSHIRYVKVTFIYQMHDSSMVDINKLNAFSTSRSYSKLS